MKLFLSVPLRSDGLGRRRDPGVGAGRVSTGIFGQHEAPERSRHSAPREGAFAGQQLMNGRPNPPPLSLPSFSFQRYPTNRIKINPPQTNADLVFIILHHFTSTVPSDNTNQTSTVPKSGILLFSHGFLQLKEGHVTRIQEDFLLGFKLNMSRLNISAVNSKFEENQWRK